MSVWWLKYKKKSHGEISNQSDRCDIMQGADDHSMARLEQTLDGVEDGIEWRLRTHSVELLGEDPHDIPTEGGHRCVYCRRHQCGRQVGSYCQCCPRCYADYANTLPLDEPESKEKRIKRMEQRLERFQAIHESLLRARNHRVYRRSHKLLRRFEKVALQ